MHVLIIVFYSGLFVRKYVKQGKSKQECCILISLFDHPRVSCHLEHSSDGERLCLCLHMLDVMPVKNSWSAFVYAKFLA